MDKLSKDNKRSSYETIDQIPSKKSNGSRTRLYTEEAANLNTITSTSRKLRQQKSGSQSKHRSIDHLHYYSLRQDGSKQKRNSIALKNKI